MAPLARSLVSALRTSRCALQQRPSTNPLFSVLSRDSTSLRTYATVFERNKPHVNIGTIGHVDHGKVFLERVELMALPVIDKTYRLPLQQLSQNDKRKSSTRSF